MLEWHGSQNCAARRERCWDRLTEISGENVRSKEILFSNDIGGMRASCKVEPVFGHIGTGEKVVEVRWEDGMLDNGLLLCTNVCICACACGCVVCVYIYRVLMSMFVSVLPACWLSMQGWWT